MRWLAQYSTRRGGGYYPLSLGLLTAIWKGLSGPPSPAPPHAQHGVGTQEGSVATCGSMNPDPWNLHGDSRLLEEYNLPKITMTGAKLWGSQGIQLLTPAPLWPSLLRQEPGLVGGGGGTREQGQSQS